MLTRTNSRTYATEHRTTYKMKVEFCLDMVPGAFAAPQDLMEWICQNPYVKSVSFDMQQLER